MKTLTKTLVILLLSSTMTMAQNNLNDMEYGAYLNQSKTLWKSVVEKRSAIYAKSSKPDDLFLLASAQHGLMGATMADKDEDLFDEYLDQTEENLAHLIEDKYRLAEAKALLSSVYGFEMGYSSWKGMYLGSKSSDLIKDATKLDEHSPLVWQIYASSKFFTPSMFGGDKNEAVKAFEKSVGLYEQAPESLTGNWRYLDALVWLGVAYSKTDQNQKAIAIYEKALQIEPDFKWVSDVLLPKAQNK